MVDYVHNLVFSKPYQDKTICKFYGIHYLNVIDAIGVSFPRSTVIDSTIVSLPLCPEQAFVEPRYLLMQLISV